MMHFVKADRPAATSNPVNRFLFTAIILLILLTVVVYVNNAYKALRPVSLPQNVVKISQSELEEKYGLSLNLVAVTAAGGMVDLRLKIIDGEKAKLLLQDKKNFPAVFVSDSNVTLNASEDTKSQEFKFEKDSNIFLLYPNAGNAAKPGSFVIILFGNMSLEPIVVK